MGFFKRLFGGKGSAEAQGGGKGSAQEQAGGKPSETAPALIRVWDSFGREYQIPRSEWRKMLPENVRKARNSPDDLATLIIQSLQDEFFEEMLEPARRLLEIEPQGERGHVLLGIVLLRLARLDEAERTLQSFIDAHGPTGTVLTNLAKVHSARGENDRSLTTLWRAIEADPNQDNGLLWYEAIFRERGGEAAGLDALRRAAALPGSWRAQLWLARAALDRDVPSALALYEQALAAAGRPTPPDLLMQMTGDLGNAGRLAELIALALPRFDAAVHGLMAGNNLIKACVETGRPAEARKLLEALYAQNRPDWKATLNFWDTEIARKRLEGPAREPDQPITVTMLSIDGPVWLRDDSPAAVLFPRVPPGAPLVCFLGSSADVEQPCETVQVQLADAPGRMSRALPLFLAEQTCLHADARARTFIPWIMGNRPGFMLRGGPWDQAEAVQHVRENDPAARYLVLSHIISRSVPWKIEVCAIRTADGSRLGAWQVEWNPAAPNDTPAKLAMGLLAALQAETGLGAGESLSGCPVLPGALLADYFLRLEQLLAVRSSNLDGVAPDFLHGEREILDGNLQLCLQQPANPGIRILLLQTLLSMKKHRPAIVAEYADKVRQLQRQNPLPSPAGEVIERMAAEALTA